MVSLLYIPYSWKYWQELNLVVGSQIIIANELADLNLVVRYGIAIHNILYVSKKFLADVKLAVAQVDCQTAKFNSPPNFPAIQYILS